MKIHVPLSYARSPAPIDLTVVGNRHYPHLAHQWIIDRIKVVDRNGLEVKVFEDHLPHGFNPVDIFPGGVSLEQIEVEENIPYLSSPAIVIYLAHEPPG